MNAAITLGALAVAGLACLVSAGVIWLARRADEVARELEERREADDMPLPRFTPFAPRSQAEARLPAGPLTVAERQDRHLNLLLLSIGLGVLLAAHLPLWDAVP